MQALEPRQVVLQLARLTSRFVVAGLAFAAALASGPARADTLLYAPHAAGTVTAVNDDTGVAVDPAFITGLSGAHDIARTPQGDLVVALTAGNKVAKYSSSGSVVSATLISVAAPTAIAVAPDGNIYVATSTKVSKYGPFGTLITSDYITGLSGVSDLAIDYQGENLFVAQKTGNVVSKYKLGDGSAVNASLVSVVSPNAIALSQSDGLYIAAGSGVSRYSQAGVIDGSFSLNGLSSPARLAINNPEGRLYVGLSTGAIRVASYNAATGAAVNAVLLPDTAGDLSLLVRETGAQTIYFPQPANVLVNALDTRLVATSTSGLPVRFEIVSGSDYVTLPIDSDSLNPNTVLIPKAVGSVTIRAIQDGDGSFDAATSVERTFSIVKAPQTITFTDVPDFTIGSGSTILGATASSNLPVTFTLVSGPATLTGGLLKPTSGGTIVVRASQAGNDTYEAAPDVEQTIEVAKKAQVITFTQPDPQAFGASPFNISAVSDSGLAVAVAVTSGPATISGKTVTLTGAGTVTLTASQAGNDTYAAASDVVRMFAVGATSQTITFPTQAMTLGGAAVTLGATASSGLPVTYTYISGPGTLVGATLTATGVGDIVIQADQSGNDDIEAAPFVQATFTVGPKGNVITFPAIADATFGDSAITLAATASGGLPVSYSVLSGPATVLGGSLTLTGAGTVVVRASQAGGGGVTAATPVDRTLNVAKAAQTITFGELEGATFASPGVSYGLGATASSGLPIVYSLDSGAGTITDGTLSIRGAGTLQVRASQPGNANYLPATAVVRSLVVAKSAQAITFAALPDRTFAKPAPSYNLSATAASGLPVTFTVVEGPATLAGSVLTLAGAGSVTVRASQAGNPNYLAAESVERTFAVAKAAQSIAFNPSATRTYSDVPVALGGTATSGLPVAYEIVSGPGSVSEGYLTITGAGTIVIRASQAGGDNFLAAEAVQKSIVVSPAAQTITFAAPANRLFTDPALTLTATASSGLPVSFAVVSGPATLDGNVLTPTGTGTVLLRATQAGNDNYLAAASVQRSFRIAASAQTIEFAELDGRTFGDAPLALSATASSGLPVTFRVVSGPATLAGNTLAITGAGSVVVRAAQAGNANYLPAEPVDRTLAVAKAAQSIAFAKPDDRLYGPAATTLSATATSGLPVTFALVEGPGTVSGSGVTPTGVGTVSVRASQAGDADYLAAESVVQSFDVSASPAEVALGSLAQTYTGSPLAATATTSPEGLTVAIAYRPAATPEAEPTSTAPTAAGSYLVTATVTTEGSIGSATGTLVIAKAPLTVTARDESKLVGTANPTLGFTYSGFLADDSEAAVSVAPSVSTTAVTSSPVGEYPVTLSGGSAANYAFVLVPGVLKVVTYSGPYETLLYSTDSIETTLSRTRRSAIPVGKLEITVPASGADFSGKVTLAGEPAAITIKGRLSLSEQLGAAIATVSFVGKPATNRYTLSLSVGGDGLEIALGKNDAPLAYAGPEDAAQIFVSAANKPAPWAGAHTLILDYPYPAYYDDSRERVLEVAIPGGSGYATATISPAGLLTLSGKLPDGTVLSGTARAGVDGSFRVFLKPYGARINSYLAGKLDLELHPDINNRYVGASSSRFFWTKAAGATDANYRSGIPLVGFESVTLDPWLPVVKATQLSEAITLADRLGLASDALVYTEFDLNEKTSTNLPESAVLTALNKLVPDNAAALGWSVAVAPATGLFTGKLVLKDLVGTKTVARTVTINGVLRQPTKAEIAEGSAFIGAATLIVPGLGTPAPTPTSGALRLYSVPAVLPNDE